MLKQILTKKDINLMITVLDTKIITNVENKQKKYKAKAS